MKRSKLWLMLTLTVLGLLLSGANGSAALKDKRHNHNHKRESTQQRDPSNDQQIIIPPSPAYQAAILETLRAILDADIARNKQEHADREDWNTPTFWISVVLAFIGAAYTFFAGWQLLIIRHQTRLLTLSTRIQRYAAFAADKSAESTRLSLSRDKPFVFVENLRIDESVRKAELPVMPSSGEVGDF
jgi:hypothetical protein